MIFGRVDITETSVETHRDSYLLPRLTVVSVRRPLLLSSLLVAAGAITFGVAFIDLLYLRELAALLVIALTSLVVGSRLALISLLSRDLRGSELAGMVWGTHGHLQKVRREITAAMTTNEAESSS